jgi:hypothetical protein
MDFIEGDTGSFARSAILLESSRRSFCRMLIENCRHCCAHVEKPNLGKKHSIVTGESSAKMKVMCERKRQNLSRSLAQGDFKNMPQSKSHGCEVVSGKQDIGTYGDNAESRIIPVEEARPSYRKPGSRRKESVTADSKGRRKLFPHVVISKVFFFCF